MTWYEELGVKNPYYADDAVALIHADCREVLPTLGRFDLLLTDPPYGISYVVKPQIVGKGNKRIMMGGKDAIYGDNEKFDPSFMMNCSDKKIMFGANYYSDILPVCGAWIVWDKTGGGRGPNNTFADVELAWTNIGKQPRIFHYLWKGLVRDGEAGDKVLHPTQKPTALMAWCLQLVPDAVTVLDPFAGSGTTGRACKDLGRKCVLIEREEKYCEIAAKRMLQEVLF